MAESFASFGQRLDNFADKLSGSALRKITNDVAFSAKKDGMKELVHDVGGDLRMRGWKLKFNVRYDILTDETAQVYPTPSGPWSVLDRGRLSAVAPKRKRGNRHMLTPWGYRTYSKGKPLAIGPTKGKHTWYRASNTMHRETPKRVHIAVQKVMREVFTNGI